MQTIYFRQYFGARYQPKNILTYFIPVVIYAYPFFCIIGIVMRG